MMKEFSKENIKVSKIYTYPIKSCHENEEEKALVTEFGLINDRKLVIIKKENLTFVSMRTHPKMYQITTKEISEKIFEISIPGYNKPFSINIAENNNNSGRTFQIKIWKIPSEVAQIENEELTKALCDFLNDEVLLVKPVTSRKLSDYKKTSQLQNFKSTDKTYFADLAPILITSEESFEYLNKIISQGGDKLQMLNFRPNIVLKGGNKPFWEDELTTIKIGNVQLRRIKGCTRCKMTTYDLLDQNFRPSKEPLETLSKIRYDKDLDGVIFGQNFCIDLNENLEANYIKVNDEVEIL